jgi:hypothetical protein
VQGAGSRLRAAENLGNADRPPAASLVVVAVVPNPEHLTPNPVVARPLLPCCPLRSNDIIAAV